MKTFVKISLIIFMCCVCAPAIAASRFIIKYKPNEAQAAFLLAHRGIDEKWAKAQIRVQMMGNLSQEKIDVLSKAAGAQAKDFQALCTGSHVIMLSKDLDEKQTRQFIRNVQQDNSVEYIEEDKIGHAASPLLTSSEN
jgi:hypothetical protein